MIEKHSLVQRIETLVKAAKSGDADLISFAALRVNEILNTLPDNWSKKEEEKPTEPEQS